ncbi:hypothetical protein TBLA_0F01560 [Henningerozyma blattae CBS 6284]|uniref:Beta-mannosyltransferase 1 n=1 Tax=Henningerozyma blattae (strain ATCC 34711 / CBS 6284 / DSM 70876 / NBRC 10599 / NRRL Y-10934 / UCD 77-7) TaxID=1071380 RepID=I2H5P6_HENB6|nr:hypothetical protein TBLA_0F01560 [Tetrapisispora blattae CBS 6284]CCH61698.1 hypothetical protein TBLA_0F01560 [Tetrapisispora blattae CBS 6284]
MRFIDARKINKFINENINCPSQLGEFSTLEPKSTSRFSIQYLGNTAFFKTSKEMLKMMLKKRYRLRITCYKLVFLIIFTLPTIFIILQSNLEVSSINLTDLTFKPSKFPFLSSTIEYVDTKRALVDLDISKNIHYNPNSSPINSRIINEKYSKYEVKGFVSNLNSEKLKAKKHKKSHKDKLDINNFKNSDGEIISVKNFETLLSDDYSSLTTCEDLAFTSSISYSDNRTVIGENIFSLREEILNSTSFLKEILYENDELERENEEIVNKRWNQFGTSGVWLEGEQCYITASRIMYSKSESKSDPTVSFIRLQAFDRDWNEIKNKSILKFDAPDIIQNTLRKFEKELSKEVDCEQIYREKDVSNTEYEQCIENKDYFEQLKVRKNTLLRRYYVTYPTNYDVPFNLPEKFAGPEDPRIILRRTKNVEEPIIIFNMNDGESRKMHAYLPHRNVNKVVKFRFENMNHDTEKNWAPFFTEQDLQLDSILSHGSIHLVYRLNPLEIARCSLDDGLCEKVFEKSTLELSKQSVNTDIRGGTQFIPLPSSIPKINGKQIWVGFTKIHLRGCGCSEHYYRPMLSVMVEKHGVYHQDLVVPNLSFETDVINWQADGTKCNRGNNIMSPNSIAAWEVVGQDPFTKKIDDYMVFTYSESDKVSSVITIRGVLEYIIRVYGETDVDEDFIPSQESDTILGKSLNCFVDFSVHLCKQYGKAH